MIVLSSAYSAVAYILPFLFVLTIVVFFHEMGHFLVGRWCGVKVETFSLGFGPELLHYTDRKGTRWRLALLPLGGYVKFFGDANAASVPDADAVAVMSKPERSVSLFGQPVWKRAAIVGAGPIANFLLAIVIFAGMLHFVGREVLKPQIAVVMKDSAAQAAGFQAQDTITAIDGQPIQSFTELQRMVMTNDGDAMTFTVDRAGAPTTIVATPRRIPSNSGFGPSTVPVLGLQPLMAGLHVEKYPLLSSLRLGASETWFVIRSTGQYLGSIIRGRESADQISGPIGTAVVSRQIAQMGMGPLMQLAAVLSVSIGMLNLLPIPLLDGGFLMFFAFEAIRGKALGERIQTVGFRIGLTFVAALSLFAAFNDISRLAHSILH